MTMQAMEVSLENLGAGAAMELFNAELQRVLDNIMDPNTKATLKREVRLKVSLKPDEDRELVTMEIHSDSKIAPVNPYLTQAYIGKERGRAVAYEYNPKQMHMQDQLDQAEEEGKVVPMTPKEGVKR